MEIKEAEALCRRWLPAWSGGADSVERLLSNYSPDAFYLDPARPAGLRGHAELRGYFLKLLAKNPDWVWRTEEILPTEMGFVLKWRAEIPRSAQIVTVSGLDIVEVQSALITRNEVYFDRTVFAG